MTDLQRHLKGIRKLVYTAVQQTDADGAVDVALLSQRLRAYLPQSYGIAEGADHGLPAALMIYDVPLVQKSEQLRLEHTLLVLDVSWVHDQASLAAALERIAAIKSLPQKRRPMPISSEEQPISRGIPKSRLPYALLVFDHFAGFPAPTTDLYEAINGFLRQHPTASQPDEIDVIGQDIQYLNPLLEEDNPRPSDMSLSRTPNLIRPSVCYVCGQRYVRRHFFYDSLCLRCGDLNYQKRSASADLRGYIALVTGARVKIGYETSLRLLRAGAEVIATSRFPRSAASRYAAEADFDQWRDRLHIFGIDLRQIPYLERFIEDLYERFPHLDILVNNAAQTIKRPPAYYAHLIPQEIAPLHELPEAHIRLLGDGAIASAPPALFGSPMQSDFPVGQLDAYGEQIDSRSHTSWTATLDELSASEILEVHLVNAVAPAVLAGQLKGLLERSPFQHGWIINVSASEGQFAREKLGTHPHTNMAKAALNMLTRSIASNYAAAHIYVNSVDPGWVSDQIPRGDNLAHQTINLPLDMKDAAARVCDLVFSDIHIYGKLWKNYIEASW